MFGARPTPHGLKLAAMAALEDAFAVRLGTEGISAEARDAWKQYQRVKAIAFAGSHSTSAALTAAQQNEAATALRLAIVALVKLVF